MEKQFISETQGLIDRLRKYSEKAFANEVANKIVDFNLLNQTRDQLEIVVLLLQQNQ